MYCYGVHVRPRARVRRVVARGPASTSPSLLTETHAHQRNASEKQEESEGAAAQRSDCLFGFVRRRDGSLFSPRGFPPAGLLVSLPSTGHLYLTPGKPTTPTSRGAGGERRENDMCNM